MYNIRLIKEAIDNYGSPLYLYAPDMVKSAIHRVQDYFKGFDFLYSVKTNPFGILLEIMHDTGVGIDAASKNEVLASSEAGHAIGDIYYSAPGKSKKDILACMGHAHLIADSLRELQTIDICAKQAGIQVDAGIRLNIPNPEMQQSAFEVMGGAASKFGVDFDLFMAAVPDIKALTNLHLNGLHVYFGSQLMDARILADNFAAISRAALQMDKYFPLAYINYGGGFGVPYTKDEKDKPDLLEAARLILADEATQAVSGKGIRRNIELGRYLVAPCGIYVTTVADIKHSGGKVFVILDGGMNQFFRPKFTGQTHRITVLDGEERPAETVCLTGNTCTPLDVFYDSITLPRLEAGDILVFENAGAYGYSMSLLDFISFDKPAQIMADWRA